MCERPGSSRGSARHGLPRAPNRLLWKFPILHGEKGGSIGAQNGTSLILSRAGACAPAVFQQGFWFAPQAEPKVWNQRNDPLSIVAADIGLPELSSIVICSSVPT